MRVKRFGLIPGAFFSCGPVFRSGRFDFFVTPGLVRVRHGRLRSKTFSCTAEVAHGYRCVLEPMVCRSGLGQEKTFVGSAQASDLAAIAIVLQPAPMADGFGSTD